MTTAKSGPLDAITDVRGLRVGHTTQIGAGWLTGTTVLLAPPGGMLAAVDVHGGGPATRETDALAPGRLVERVDAIVLTGGSAYGLDAAGGVMHWLEQQHRGVPVGAGPYEVVPVVPTAALFDLGRGGEFTARPSAEHGYAAVSAAAASPQGAPVERGVVGAGTGALAGGLKGGIGTASVVVPLEDGTSAVVAALVAVNASGSAFGADGRLLSRPDLEPVTSGPPQPAVVAPFNTTIGIVATDLALDRAQAWRTAQAAQAGIARAIDPVATLVDGDTLFAVSTATVPLPEGLAGLAAVRAVQAAAAHVVTAAIADALLSARTVHTHTATYRAYGDTSTG